MHNRLELYTGSTRSVCSNWVSNDAIKRITLIYLPLVRVDTFLKSKVS